MSASTTEEKEREIKREMETRRSVGNEKEEPKDREKTCSRRRHYPRRVIGRRDAAISTYRPPRLLCSSSLIAISLSLSLSLSLLSLEFTLAKMQEARFRAL